MKGHAASKASPGRDAAKPIVNQPVIRRVLAPRACQAVAPPRPRRVSRPLEPSSTTLAGTLLDSRQPSQQLASPPGTPRSPRSPSQLSDSPQPSAMSIRSSLMSVVAAATVISAPPPSSSPSLVNSIRRPASADTSTGTFRDAMSSTASQAGKAAATTAVQAAQAAVQAAGQMLAAVVAAAPRSLGSVPAVVAEQWSEDLARMGQAWAALKARGTTVEDLQAKVQALQAERDSLAAQLHETQQRLKFTETVSGNMAAQLEEKRALQVLDGAMQVFRRHIGGVPATLNVADFTEYPENVIGKGGCATVYRWQAHGGDWAVKADPITHRHAYAADFDPQRCGDLLPAFLPPHANIMAPRAWWVTPLPAPSSPPASRSAVKPLTPAPGFQLYTLYERYTCSLWDHLQSLHTATQQATGAQGTGTSGSKAQTLLMDLRSLLTVVRDVAAALEHLAQHRVVHGDVKMENVLLVLQPDRGKGKVQRVSKAVLIDFGLCCMLPSGVDKMPARGGTWLFKAPEQMTGPPGITLGGQERTDTPHVELQTDVWALGALICMLCNNGVLASKAGLPFSVPEDKLVKWGDRPKDGTMEPFYMVWEDILPKVPSASAGGLSPAPSAGAIREVLEGAEGCAVSQSVAQVQHAHVMALLRRLAWGCMQVKPGQRLTAGQVRAAAAEALASLCDS